MRKLIFMIFLAFFVIKGYTQGNQLGLGYGGGIDGSITVNSGTPVYTDRDRAQVSNLGLTNYVSGAGNCSFDRIDVNYTNPQGSFTSMTPFDPGCNSGDIVMIIQMEGSNIGEFILAKVQNVNAGSQIITIFDWQLNPTTDISNSTGTHLFDVSSSAFVQIIRIPQYTDVTINNGGIITCTPYNSNISGGGVICFEANGNLTINDGGRIDASHCGYGTNNCLNVLGTGGTGGTGGSHIPLTKIGGAAFNDILGVINLPTIGNNANNPNGLYNVGECVTTSDFTYYPVYNGANGGMGGFPDDGITGNIGLTGLPSIPSSSRLNYLLVMGNCGKGGNGGKGGQGGGAGGTGGGGYGPGGNNVPSETPGNTGGNGGNGGAGGGIIYIRALNIYNYQNLGNNIIFSNGENGISGINGQDNNTPPYAGQGGGGGNGGSSGIFTPSGYPPPTDIYIGHGGVGKGGQRGDGPGGGDGGNGGDAGSIWIAYYNVYDFPKFTNNSVVNNGGAGGTGGTGGAFYATPAPDGIVTSITPITPYPNPRSICPYVNIVSVCDCDKAFNILAQISDPTATYNTNTNSITYASGIYTSIYHSDLPYGCGGLLESTQFVNSIPGSQTTPATDNYIQYTCQFSLIPPDISDPINDHSDINFLDNTWNTYLAPIQYAINNIPLQLCLSSQVTVLPDIGYNVDFIASSSYPHTRYEWYYPTTMTFYGESYAMNEGKLTYSVSPTDDYIVYPYCTPPDPITFPHNGKNGNTGNTGNPGSTPNPDLFQDNPYNNQYWVFSTLDINKKLGDNIKFTIMPNPAKDKIFITFIDKDKINYNYKITGMNSQTVMTGTFKSNNGQNKIRLDVDKFSKGEYTIEINSLNVKFTTKFILN